MTTKKRLLLPALALVCLLGLGVGVFYNNLGLLSGCYLRGSSGAHIVITTAGTPYVMEDRASGGLFDDLADGDRVLVAYDRSSGAVFPARAGAYWCWRLGLGQVDDLPPHTLTQLVELGWISTPL